VSDIIGAIQKPEWWFTTILVAVIANVGASYLYEWLRPAMAGRWLFAAKLTHQCVYLVGMFWCAWNFPVSPAFRFMVITATLGGLVICFLEIIGFIQEPLSGKKLLMQMLTMYIFVGAIYWEPGFDTAWQTKNIQWFASQVGASLFIGLTLSTISNLIFFRQHIRSKRGLR